MYHTTGNREGAFRPIEISKERFNGDFPATGFKRTDTENVFDQPCGGAGAPAMAQGASITLIAALTIVAMDIFLSGNRHFVYVKRIVRP